MVLLFIMSIFFCANSFLIGFFEYPSCLFDYSALRNIDGIVWKSKEKMTITANIPQRDFNISCLIISCTAYLRDFHVSHFCFGFEEKVA